MKTHIQYIPADIEAFIERLENEGAQLKDLTNEWELVRWKWNDVILIVYKTKHDLLSFSDVMGYHQYIAYKENTAWPHLLREQRKNNTQP